MSRPVLEILKAPDFSDGDSTHRPDTDARFPIDPEPVLKAVASKWIMENVGDAEPGKFSWTIVVGTLLVIVMSAFLDWNPVLRAKHFLRPARSRLTI